MRVAAVAKKKDWAWSAWRNNKKRMERLQRAGAILEFPKVNSICQQILNAARNDAKGVELQYRKQVINNAELPGRGKRQRKEIDSKKDNPDIVLPSGT